MRDSKVVCSMTIQIDSTEPIFDDMFVRVERIGPTFRINLKSVDILVAATVKRFFGVSVFLPESFDQQQATSSGLFGSADGSLQNDWMAPDGTVLAIPTAYPDMIGREAYDYCVTNWCIRTEAESIFTYSDIPFSEISRCDDPYPGDIDLNSATAELRELCGQNTECLIDGIEFGIEAAQDVLVAQSTALGFQTLRSEPSSIAVGISRNAILTVDVSGISIDSGDSVESFNVFRVDPETRVAGDIAIVNLFDNGEGLDANANDNVFTGVLAVRSDVAGEIFAFKVVPVVNGIEDQDSSLVQTNLNAIVSFSTVSGIVSEVEDMIQTMTADTIVGLSLKIDFTWPADQGDLDTGAFFLSAGAGSGCGSGSQYLLADNSENGSGGFEGYTISVGESFADGVWFDSTSVDLSAAWLSGSGPASVTVSIGFTDTLSGEFIVEGDPVSFVFDEEINNCQPSPLVAGLSSRSCNRMVGRIDVSILGDETAEIKVTKVDPTFDGDDTAEAIIGGVLVHFNNGNFISPGIYEIRYDDGCLQDDNNDQLWTVNVGGGSGIGVFDFDASCNLLFNNEFRLPGTVLDDRSPNQLFDPSRLGLGLFGLDGGFATYEECVATNKELFQTTSISVAFREPTRLALLLRSPNFLHGLVVNPTWRLTTGKTVEGDVFGGFVNVMGPGKALQPGTYEVRYIDGCMKYSPSQAWTVQAKVGFEWNLRGFLSPNNVIARLPGTAGTTLEGGGFATYEECVAANKELASDPENVITFTLTEATLLGVLVDDDSFLDDNVEGLIANPTWRITQVTTSTADTVVV